MEKEGGLFPRPPSLSGTSYQIRAVLDKMDARHRIDVARILAQDHP